MCARENDGSDLRFNLLVENTFSQVLHEETFFQISSESDNGTYVAHILGNGNGPLIPFSIIVNISSFQKVKKKLAVCIALSVVPRQFSISPSPHLEKLHSSVQPSKKKCIKRD